MKGKLYTDGACFNNPGPMGLGVVLEIPGNTIKKSIPAGIGTNNKAEYMALIEGLKLALDNKVTELDAFLDSQLVVNQIKGDWRVKHSELKPLYLKAKQLISQLQSFSIHHIDRELNSVADNLSKLAASNHQE